MSVFLHSAKIIKGPSPSQFALAAAEGSTAEFTLRLTLSSNGRLVYDWMMICISLANVDRVPCADTYRIRGDHCTFWYDPIHCDGYADIDELSDSIT